MLSCYIEVSSILTLTDPVADAAPVACDAESTDEADATPDDEDEADVFGPTAAAAAAGTAVDAAADDPDADACCGGGC